MRGTTNAQRQAAAANAAARRATMPQAQSKLRARSNAVVGTPGAGSGVIPSLDQLYFSGVYPNYANSPLPNPADTINCGPPNYCGIRKFVDTLPLLNQPNNLNGMLPVAVPDTITFPGSDYYEISLVQYRQKLHSDLPATLIRGYVQTNKGTDATGANSIMPAAVSYLGPIIVAQKDRPVRIKFTNMLPSVTNVDPADPQNTGNLFIPTDTTVLGAGLGTANGQSPYLQNRATIHLHGGNTPWISDGTPHQWTVPAADWGNTLYDRGDSVAFVPDMFFDAQGMVIPQCGAVINGAAVTTSCSDPTGKNNAATLPPGATNDPGNGSLTFYYTNQQSQRLLFYHDHAYGVTRLNVYAGEAAGYVIRDQAELDLMNGTNISGVFTAAGVAPAPVIPSGDAEIPLVIQDKGFVPQSFTSTTVYSVPVLAPGSGYTTATVSFTGGCTVEPTATATVGNMTDPFGMMIYGAVTGITMLTPGSGCTSAPVVSITGNGTGAAAFASIADLNQQDPTWDPALWGGYGNFWYPHVYMTNQWPGNPDGSNTNPMGRWDYAGWFWPPFNGVPGQYTVRGEIPCPTAYNANMMCPGFPSPLAPAPLQELDHSVHLGQGSTVSLTPEAFLDTPVVNGTPYPTLTVDPKPYRFRILSVANERTFNLSWFLACDSKGGTAQYTPTAGATCPADTVTGSNLTEVGMVPAVQAPGFPVWYPNDARAGGVPDPAAMGPSWVEIASEGGVLPAPAVIPPTPVTYEQNLRSITVTNIQNHGMLLMSAERADAIVDFTPYAGKTLILYNDAPAPAPAYDTRNDYYTGDPDQTGTGGAPTTLAGFGPNTRTVMQVYVRPAVAGSAQPAVNMAALNALIPAAFKLTQPVPVVPEAAYSQVYGQALPNNYVKLQSTDLVFTPMDPITQKLSTQINPDTGNTTVKMPVRFKTIQELFELDYGRMNATLGTELPFTNFNNQTTIPLGYVDPFTEDVYDSANVAASPIGFAKDGSQIWMVIHNGVDSHAIHFHLEDVQLINRFGWDGTNRPPFPNELGWKDTVRMNPLEIDFVALRPMSQNLPFPVPDSHHLFDVTKPVNTTPDPAMSTFNPANNAAPQANTMQAMGWEYVWHCHLLGHEENDMMREEVFQVPPQTPSGISATWSGSNVNVSFTDMSLSETGFTLQRADDVNFTVNVVNIDIPGASPGWNNAVSYADAPPTLGATYYYRVRTYKPDADYWKGILMAGGSWPDLVSPWSGVAQTGAPPSLTITPTGALAFGSQLVGTPSAAQTITLTNTGAGTLAVGAIAFAGLNPSDFTQTNTCGTSLAGSGGTCAISVTFTPIAAGARAANLTFTTTDPANPLVSIAAAGTGISPVMTVTPPSIAFGNQQVGTTSTQQSVITISNATGTAPLSITSLGLTGANIGDFTMTQTCGTAPITLLAGTSCTATIGFAPTAAGARTAAFTVVGAAPASTQAVALSGTGTIPVAALAPASLTFASQLVNTASAAQTVTLSNTGLAPLTISSIAFAGANPGDFLQTSTCTTTLAANATCTISVSFKPLARGARTATLVVTDNATPATQTVTLAGTGIAPIAGILPAGLNFGIQAIATTSAAQSVVLSNTGDAALAIASVTIGGANATDYLIAASNCPTSLPALSSCLLSVTFKPNASGPSAGTLSIASNDPVNPILQAPLVGTGTAVALSPSAVAFANQTQGTVSTWSTVTLVNVGTTTLTINSVALGGTNPTSFQLSNLCGGTLLAGRNCTIRVRFAPLSTGALTASLIVNTSDLGVPSATVALSGTGVAPALSASPTSLTFSSPLNTTTVAQTVTLSNIGTAPLTINGITLGGTNVGQFAQTNNCVLGTPMAVGASCTVNVTFRPTSTTPLVKSQTLNITVAAPATSQSVPLTGNVILPTYAVAPTAVPFPNQAINTTSTAQTVTITNTGTVPLPLTNIAITGTNANQFAQTNTCGASVFRPFPSTLAVGSSCTVSVTFRPTRRAANTAALTVSVGGGATPAQTNVSLTGTGQ